MSAAGTRPDRTIAALGSLSAVETAGYWSCWAIIFGLVVYAVMELNQ